MQNRSSYALMRQNFPDHDSVPAVDLWRGLGHPENARNPLWRNTCAVRMSLALVGAGVVLPHGFLTVRAGKYKGRKLEIKQEALADYLATIWGEPEKFGAALIRERVRTSRGVIRFVNLWGPFDPQGHIDLIAPDQWGRLMCAGDGMYWHAVECWFWECPD